MTSITNISPELKHVWHPIGRIDSFTESPTRIELVGDPYVVVRLDGQVKVFADVCPHRYARLSDGIVVGSNIQCPYHGWQFGANGKCAHVPALGADATLPPAQLTAWLKACSLHRLTPHTITQVGPLRQVVAKVRRDDYCLAVEEHELGVHALAVPLRNLQGDTVAALNVVASPKQVDESSLQRDMLPLLQEAARELRGLL